MRKPFPDRPQMTGASAPLAAAFLGALVAAAIPAPAQAQAPDASLQAAPTGSAGAAVTSAPENDQQNGGAPPTLDEYKNIPENMMMPEQQAAKEEASDDSGALHVGSTIGFDTMLTLYQQGQYDKIAKDLEALAHANHHGAQELIGIMYENGQGVPKDSKKAYEFLSQAADANRPLAQHHIAVMYYQGNGVSADPILALMWLQIAILHYPDGPEKARAQKDRDNMYTRLDRREKDRAMMLTRDWLTKKGESDLLDLQGL